MTKGSSTYSFPAGMYAKFLHHSKIAKKEITKLQREAEEKGRRRLDFSEYQSVLQYDNDIFVSAYTRFARYIMRHNNLTKAQIKDKKHYSTVSFPVYDFISSIYPSLIHINGRGEKHIDNGNFSKFLNNAQQVYLLTDDFLFYPVLEGERDGKLIYGLYTDKERAIKGITKAVKKHRQKMSPIRERRCRRLGNGKPENVAH
jgi:hypothetical protein